MTATVTPPHPLTTKDHRLVCFELCSVVFRNAFLLIPFFFLGELLLSLRRKHLASPLSERF
jgi:hypothetical protein